jgi:hypothetical protein
MKRSHRRWHRRVWLLLAPLLLLVIGLAVLLRNAEPRNAALPATLLAPAAQQGG